MIVCVCRGVSERRGDNVGQTVERCRSLGDNGSRDLLEEILTSEEAHINWIEAQLELIKQAGEGNYLAQQIKASDA